MTSNASLNDGDSFLKPGGGGSSSKSNSIVGFMRKRKRRLRGETGAGDTPDCSTISECNETPLATSTMAADSCSVASLELSSPPDSKRSKRSRSNLSRMTSLASVISTPVAKMGHALQRSFSGARLPQPSPNESMMSLRSGSSNLNSSSSSQQQQQQHHGFGTPTRFFSRSISSAIVASSSNHRGGESPYGTLRRGAPGRTSASHLTPYKPPQPTPNKNRPTRYWSEQFKASCANLTKQQVKFQEAVYEISCGEEDLVEDMQLVVKIYGDSLLSLKILNETEVKTIFSPLRSLSPLHVELYRLLRAQRSPQTGVSSPVGKILLQWTYKVGEPYVHYCANLIQTKAFLDARRESDKDFTDFLQRCLESPFSRKLDLWTYLDVPRSRLAKYPLLLKQVLKFSECQVDCGHLATAIRHFEQILQTVDEAMARAKCALTISRLDFLDEAHEAQCEAVKSAKEEMLDGILRNNRGTKLECHLMDNVLILGRPTTRGANNISNTPHGGNNNNTAATTTTSRQGAMGLAVPKRLQVYRTPIPVEDLIVEDLDCHVSRHGSGSSTSSSIFGGSSGSSGSSGSTSVTSTSSSDSGSSSGSSSKQGSFKSAFSGSDKPAKNSFRVGFRHPPTSAGNNGKSGSRHQTSHTLTASDEHSKRQWITTIQKTIDSMAAKKKKKLEDEMKFGSHHNVRSSPVSVSTSRLQRSVVSCRTALFQKQHKRSPRIKASLSHAAIETLKRGSSNSANMTSTGGRRNQRAASRAQCRSLAALARGTSSSSSSDETSSNTPARRALIRHLPPKPVQQHQPRIMTSGSSSTLLKKTRPRLGSGGGSSSAAVLRDATNKLFASNGRTKSWGSLVANGRDFKKQLNLSSSQDEEDEPRYLTRSKARQISRSMSDLLGVIV